MASVSELAALEEFAVAPSVSLGRGEPDSPPPESTATIDSDDVRWLPEALGRLIFADRRAVRVLTTPNRWAVVWAKSRSVSAVRDRLWSVAKLAVMPIEPDTLFALAAPSFGTELDAVVLNSHHELTAWLLAAGETRPADDEAFDRLAKLVHRVARFRSEADRLRVYVDEWRALGLEPAPPSTPELGRGAIGWWGLIPPAGPRPPEAHERKQPHSTSEPTDAAAGASQVSHAAPDGPGQ